MPKGRINKQLHRYQYTINEHQKQVLFNLWSKEDPKKRLYKKYMSELENNKKQSLEETWNINGMNFNRPTVMKKIIDWISDGNPLKLLCDQPGAPSMGIVYRWFKNYPEFEQDYRAAEEAGGHSLADQALIAAMYITEAEDVPVVKLKYDAMTRRAAQMNQKFQDKQVFRAETDVKHLSEAELLEKRSQILEKIKGELTTQGWKEPEIIENIDPIEPKNE
jgi:hypothetical protein